MKYISYVVKQFDSLLELFLVNLSSVLSLATIFISHPYNLLCFKASLLYIQLLTCMDISSNPRAFEHRKLHTHLMPLDLLISTCATLKIQVMTRKQGRCSQRLFCKC